MSNDSRLFEHVDEVIAALPEEEDEATRRMFVRAALRGISHVMHEALKRVDALTKAVSR